MIGNVLGRLCAGGLLLGAISAAAPSATAATLETAETTYFGCLHLHTVAALAQAPDPLTRGGVAGAVDAAMAQCRTQFDGYTDALATETVKQHIWSKPNAEGVRQFRDEAPAIIRQRLIDAYASGL